MLVDKFLESYYKKLVEKQLNKVVIAPKAMIVNNSEDEEGWVEWKPSKAKISIDDIREIETKYNITISKQYIEYLLSSQFMDIQINEYILYGVNEINTIAKILSFFPTNILSFGFYPIGSINDTDYLSLNKEGQVVRISDNDYSLVAILFDSFNNLIEYLSSKNN